MILFQFELQNCVKSVHTPPFERLQISLLVENKTNFIFVNLILKF